eukprot:TRINITY_DN164_c0_g1_i1.p1 TRINITY_DN164_c0_g1~~TRINITY_DN164_c0_g1_i1.p1  ORF type:complete len:154 (-),score=36.90 TRINITY_DN164_c0_g1_i1:59-520(-)
MSDTVTKGVKNAVSRVFYYEPSPKFGYGNPEQEALNCKRIQLFMSCVGATVKMRRAQVESNTILRETREKFGDSMSQDTICDENYYRFTESELNLPLHSFSNKCNLHVIFAHESWFTSVISDAAQPVLRRIQSPSSSSSTASSSSPPPHKSNL